MELYATLEQLITVDNPFEKLSAFKPFYLRYLDNGFTVDYSSEPKIFEYPSYSRFCTIVDPKTVPKRNKLDTPEGQILLLHAVAHIEYSAIDLALDAAYRFRDVGEEFTRDWLKVAEDEVRHFEMIEALLKELGSFYGACPVHDALFEASMRTLTLLERMAVVPRYLEANGLDATPLILAKLIPLKKNTMVEKIISALEVILDEEIDHVQRGDRWFKIACERQRCDSDIYFEIVERYYPRSFPRRVGINCKARKLAGFSSEDLKQISLVDC
ncbi:MAG: ferritin-like domain-containing protein [Sulfuricurvum sp.]|uniref:ferritin-like domain-containing protein n=1 Tax=Sulfuricurvum sp. TaxID=2025608 RepID=UPI0026236F4C|nr:ferritin-like domain-containing protein [Sulfuricurvum sp.]MDD2830098.1 ferritin-like domain-containing protein [Sulfuricurvum sp.]MDD4949933.1 ferritin-like domain-containing protein [Sulfuricurvum sp.]